jgi:basic membrane protein A and related proteins
LFATRLKRSAVLALAGLSLVIAACGSSGSGSSGSSGSAGSSSSSTSASSGKKIKVGLVTDIGGLNDRSFNALANKGLQDAEKQLGIDGRVLTSKANSDYIPNLSTLAQQHYDLVIGVGFLMADAINTVATKFPQTKFAVIDVDQASLKNKPKNVEGLIFKEQEAGYLAGYLAGLYAKQKGFNTISSVGGQKIPPVDHYIAGYQAGAKKADSAIKTLNGYSQDFVDQAKCKELALNQIGQGSKIVFQVAGQCGLGAIDAAKEKSMQAIGVDADQAYLGPQILTSALKKVDVAVLQAIKAAQSGNFKGGSNSVFEVKNNGVGIGTIASGAASLKPKVEAVQKQIASGQITNIPDTVGGGGAS